MATKVNKKTAPTSSPKEVVLETESTEAAAVAKPLPTAKSIGKRIAKKDPKKKSTLGVTLKPKAKKLTLNPLAKAVIHTAAKKKLIKNGVKDIKVRRRKVKVKQEIDDTPPVLEPIFPLNENVLGKKPPRKRINKKTVATTTTTTETSELIDPKSIKQENEDDLSASSDVTDIYIPEIPTLTKQVRKPKVVKKPKVESDTLEDVMKDLSFLIKTEDIKKEVDTLSESGKTDTATVTTKPKKLTKKQKLDILAKSMIKLDNIENALTKLDSSDEKIIDMLDLNVNRKKKRSPTTKRRHSIEKCSTTTIEPSTESLSIFNHLPRSISPRTKRRNRIDGASRRSSPYSTRSETPIKLLRNGKQRKPMAQELLDGLELADAKRRRRLCSDSGSKLSGYESDSSFSVSSHGTESNEIVKEEVVDIKTSLSTTTASNGPIGLIDNNSNIYSSNVPLTENEESIPEKDVLLNIMKQTFNSDIDKKDTKLKVGSVVPCRFYEGKNTDPSQDKTETILKEEVKEKIADEAPVMEDEALKLSSAAQDVIDHLSKSEDVNVEMPNLVDNSQTETDNCLTDNLQEITDNLTEGTSESIKESAIIAYEEINNKELVLPEESILNKQEKVEVEEEEQQSEAPMDTSLEEMPALKLDDSSVENSPEKNYPNLSTEMVSDSITNECKRVIMEGERNLTEDTNANSVIDNVEEDLNLNIEESAELMAAKESILQALGLQRLNVTEEAKQKTKEIPSGSTGDYYTGTLKTVIKINRDKKKGGKNSIKNSISKGKSKINTSTDEEQTVVEDTKEHKEKEGSTISKHGTHSSDTAGAHRKSHYSNRSNMDGSSEHTSDGETSTQDGAIKALVIPEKASSFSIHPGRLCKDECSYCFGKFGLFDTPCHIAQMKSVDRQNKILATEKHLTRDSCLCDACYRHVDRKSNTPSYMNKSLKRNSLVAPGPRQNHCHVLGCGKESSNILRRKWIIKMRKSICQVINIDLDNPGLHSIPICEEHYAALEHLMICAMCKRRLARNHIHYLGPETVDLNDALKSNGVPITLYDKPVVCKLCKCFAAIVLKDPSERPETSNTFFLDYKKRLLHFNDIEPMDEASAEEPITVPSRADRVEISKKRKKHADDDYEELQEELEKREERVPSTDTNSQPQSRSESPIDEFNGVDYNTLIPAIAMEVGSDSENKKDIKNPGLMKKINDMQRDGVEIVKVSKTEKLKLNDPLSRLGYGSAISVRQLFPGEEDLPLTGCIDFNNVKEKTPEGWEKCMTVIQYDEETKRLWQELQKPYGNQSSFLRHLILLEKYFRNGDLVLSPRASHHSINYSESVHNRLRAYDNIPSNAGNIQPLSMLPFNNLPSRGTTHSNITSAINSSAAMYHSNPASSVSISSKTINNSAITVSCIPSNIQKSTPLTISQLNSPPLLPANVGLHPIPIRSKVGQPPGLISLHPGSNKPVAPFAKVPQAQKIKFPITKNWRPNLIPIDPNKKPERKTGLVQVISGGKPYHITLEDYKKMCAIKRSFELKQKRLQEAQTAKPVPIPSNSVLKSIMPRKGLVISKTASTSTPPNKIEPPNLGPLSDGTSEGENILEKLDKQVEKLESKLNEKSLLLPRIPKSLTVIPQTVTKRPSRPSSPVLLITSKSSNTKS